MGAAVAVDVGVFMVAVLFFVILAVLGRVVTAPAQAAVQPIPGIGPWLAQNIGYLLGLFVNAATGAANASLGALSGSLDALNWVWARAVGNLAGLAQAMTAAAVTITTRTIPAAIGNLTGYVQSLYNTAIGYSQTLYNAAVVAAQNLYNTAIGYSQTLYNAAIGYVRQEVAAVEVDIAAAEAHAVQLAQGLIAAEEAARVAAVNAAHAEAQSLFSQAVAVGAAAEAALRNDLGAEAAALGRVITTGLNDVQAQATAQNAATAAVGASAVAVVAADVAALRAMRCLKVCDPLGALGEDLQMVDLLILLGLAEYAVHDPTGFRRAAIAEIAPAAAEMGAAARALLGVG